MTAQSKTMLFFVFLTIVSIRLFGNDFVRKDFEKTINREFSTTSKGDVKISNKYGTVQIKTWEKMSVKIDIKITVKASSTKEADVIFERIDIDFQHRSSFVSVETIIGSAKSKKSYFARWVGPWPPKDDFKIEYIVHMPESNTLQLVTKYCDATMDYLSSDADLQLKYGDVACDGFGGDVILALKYGNGKIATLHNLDATLGYGKLSLIKVNDVKLNSKYSKINISQAGDLTLKSKYDTYVLGDSRQLNIDSRYGDFAIEQTDDIVFGGKYSDLKIDFLINRAKIDTKYGNIYIANVDDGFDIIDLTGSYSDFKLGTEMAQVFCVDLSADYGDLVIPKQLTVTKKVNHGHSQSIIAYKTNSYCSSKIRGVINYGKIVLIR